MAECGDAGEPIVHRHADSPVSQVYVRLAATVLQKLNERQSADALPESFALLSGHVLPALGHAIGHSIGDATADR